jgi:proline dehydrogenase
VRPFSGYSEPDISNTERAFFLIPDNGLWRARFLFGLLRRGRLMRILGRMTQLAIRLRLPVDFLIRRLVFNHFCAGETLHSAIPVMERLQSAGVHSIPDYSAEGKCDEASFERVCREVLATLEMSAVQPGISHAVFKPSGMGSFRLWEDMSSGGVLEGSDLELIRKLELRLERIFAEAFRRGIPVMVDAEETWIQPAIDDMVRRYSSLYNREQVIVFNTLQMYRTDRLDFLSSETELARRDGYMLGYKIVRGAYHEQEMARAAKLGYPSPVYTKKEETDKAYDDAVEYCFTNRDIIGCCVATHNEASTMRVARLLMDDTKGEGQSLLFAQLYGMSDHITFNLAAAGFTVSKYLPYGPLREVIPYLLRRAEENSSVSGQTGRELHYLDKEWKRRRGKGG